MSKETDRDQVELASESGRHGHRRVAALPRAEGFRANHERVERPWRREGLKVPQEQPRSGRPWPGEDRREGLEQRSG